MATLPALANLLAIRDENSHALADLTEKIRASGNFDKVFHPAPHWVCAKKYLPDSQPDPEEALGHGFVFLEGREEIERSFSPGSGYGSLAQRISHSPETLAELPGDFSFLHFKNNGDILIARCIAGLVPVYSWQTPQRLALSTRLDYLVNLAGTPREPDYLVYAIFACAGVGLPDWRSPLRNVHVIPNGTFQQIQRSQLSTPRSYFKAKLPERRLPTNEEINQRAADVRTAIFGYMQRHLHPRAYNLCSFSGGVDSSCLVSLMAAYFKVPTATWSLIPSQEPDRSRELSYIDPLLATLGITKTWKIFLENNTNIDLLQNSAPTIFPILQQVLMTLPSLVKELDIRTVVGGEFADEAFGSVKTTPDLSQLLTVGQALALTLGGRPWTGPRWLKHHLQWQFGKPLLPYLDELRDCIRPSIRDEYRQWVCTTRAQVMRSEPRNYYLLRSCDMFWAFSAMCWEACSPLGIRRLVPYFNRRILELACGAHPYERVHDGIKTLLRRALRGYVPWRNLQRPDKGGISRRSLPTPASLTLTGEVARLMVAPEAAQHDVVLGGLERATASRLLHWLGALHGGAQVG